MKWRELKPWQKKKMIVWPSVYVLIAIIFIGFVICHMISEGSAAGEEYKLALANDGQSLALEQELSGEAVPVTTGTYVETIKEISLKNCNFRVSFIVWFKWAGEYELDFTGDQFRIYNGTINKKEVLADMVENGLHYQEFRIDATVSKSFNIARFPLGNQVLKFYVEPNEYTASEVILVPDRENSGVNQNLSISGYSLKRHDVGEHVIVYPNTMNHPEFTRPRTSSELVTVLEISHSNWGLYLKCFIALLGTTVWIFIVLYICANHMVNPLGTIPAALFGTIGNLMVGANLLPDVVQVGLVEYVNLYGTMIILAGALSIININRIREQEGGAEFARLYGRTLFFVLLVLCIAGQILMPVSANMWS